MAAIAVRRARVRRWLMLLVLLPILPAPVRAQTPAFKAQFLGSLGEFSLALTGRHGDEGAHLAASLDQMAAVLARWDAAIASYERAMDAEIADAAPARAAQMHVALAAELLDRSLTTQAVEQLEAARTIDPTALEPPLLLGLAFSQLLGNPARAATVLEVVSDAEPGEPTSAYLLARQLAAVGDAERVAAAWSRFASAASDTTTTARAPFIRLGLLRETPGVTPFLPPVRYARGFALLRQGDLEGAIAAFREALRTDPLVTDAPGDGSPRARAATAFRDGRATDARALLQEALTADPDNAEATRVLGLVEAADGRPARAIELLGRAVLLNPNDERARLAVAEAQIEAGDLDAAVESLEATIDDLPESAAARLALADVYQQKGAKDEAVRELDAALQLGPLLGVNTIHNTIGALERDQQDFEGAAAAYEAAVALVPNDPDAHLVLGKVYYDQGRQTEAFAEFWVATRLAPTSVAAWTAMSQVHLRERRYDEALATSLRALQLDAQVREARYVYATTLIRLGRTEEGRREMETYQRLQAEDAAARDRALQLGVLRRDAELATADGEHARAAELLHQAFLLDPRAPRSHRELGLALLAAGRAAEAVQRLDMATGLGGPIETYLELAEAYDALGRTDDAARARAEYGRLKQQAIREDGSR